MIKTKISSYNLLHPLYITEWYNAVDFKDAYCICCIPNIIHPTQLTNCLMWRGCTVNVELSSLNIHAMYQSHPVSSERERIQTLWQLTFKVSIHSVNMSAINRDNCKECRVKDRGPDTNHRQLICLKAGNNLYVMLNRVVLSHSQTVPDHKQRRFMQV